MATGHERALERWWLGDPSERYWLEVSDRGADLGADLNAPTTNEVGRRFWSYDLLDEVDAGDVVLHYDRSEHAIVGWSTVVGQAWPDEVVWAARGTYARGRNIQPHERPGRRVPLRGPILLRAPLPLERIRSEQNRLVTIRAGRPYFPFELGGRPARPMQGYLFKLPAAFLDLFRELGDVPRTFAGPKGSGEYADEQASSPDPEDRPRPAFRPRNEQIRSRAARPWARDPSEVDRALSSHARIERLVAEAAAAEGWQASAYGPDDPMFDLLLEPTGEAGGIAVVVEAKSTVAGNEEKQLRLALGQVLRYRQMLMRSGRRVVAMIAVERPPADTRWSELCGQVDVLLAWPEVIGEHLRRLS